MRRTYNTRISRQANISLRRRAARVYRQKLVIAVVTVVVLLLFLLLFKTNHIFAGSAPDEQTARYKYYTSIEIQPGDTLWRLAGEYTKGTDISVSEYVDELRRMNHLAGMEIHSGEYLVISYYSNEQK